MGLRTTLGRSMSYSWFDATEQTVTTKPPTARDQAVVGSIPGRAAVKLNSVFYLPGVGKSTTINVTVFKLNWLIGLHLFEHSFD